MGRAWFVEGLRLRLLLAGPGMLLACGRRVEETQWPLSRGGRAGHRSCLAELSARLASRVTLVPEPHSAVC